MQFRQDSTFQSFETSAETTQASATPRYHRPAPPKKTVAQVLARLPRSMTEAQRDSAVQANFPQAKMTWLPGAKTELPKVGEAQGNYFERPKLQLYRSKALPRLKMQIPEVPFRPSGIAGDPVPYRFQSDDFVTTAILLSFFLVLWTIVRSRRFIANTIKNFFYEARERDNLFASRTDSELRGEVFLIFQTCFLLSISFFGYTQEHFPHVFIQVSPYKILTMALVVCCLYYLLKILLYRWVNHVFFARWQAKRWDETIFLSILSIGTLLFPTALLLVYFDIPVEQLERPFLFAVIAVKAAMLYKSYRIFFHYNWGFLHIIMYFCTLEIIPLMILWRVLTGMNDVLLTLD